MSPLLTQFHAAWKRIEPLLKHDPDELARRLARRRSPTLQRPPRDWCLVVRASDRRINPMIAAMVPEDAQDEKQPHEVTLEPELLCKNIRLAAPGEEASDVARRAGVHYSTLTTARLNNVFRTHYVRGLGAKRGHPVPLLYTVKPLRPGARMFAPPDEAWDYTALCLFFRVPSDFRQTIQRIPVWRDCSSIYRKINATSPEVTEEPPKKSRRLPPPPPDYVWYKWSRAGVNEESHYLGDDPSNWRKSPDDYGHRPAKWLPKRKQKRSKRIEYARDTLLFNGWKWQCPACKRAVRMLYLPLPPMHLPIYFSRKLQRRMIELELDFSTVNRDSDKIYKEHHVSGRRQLAQKLGVDLKTDEDRRVERTRTEIRERRQRGQTLPQIAKEMKLPFWNVHHHTKILRRIDRATDPPRAAAPSRRKPDELVR